MYKVKIRDHFMIANSLPAGIFGPAQKLHGSTFVVDVSFCSEILNEFNIVINIAEAQKILNETLEPLRYQNLDELPWFKGQLTTSEYLAQHIHDRIQLKCKNIFSGKIEVILGESHVAWASYEA
jgi:6-pyruvoyltetrahydropterin/6-carboxytetrahydropterin synthase